MYKAKLGIILPSANTVMEPEFYQMAPEGVGIFTTRVPLTTAYKRDFLKVANRVEDAAKLLSDATVDMIILGCTACSFIGGKNYDEKLAERIKKASGIRSTTTASAMVGALRELSLKKVSGDTLPRRGNRGAEGFSGGKRYQGSADQRAEHPWGSRGGAPDEAGRKKAR